MQKNKLYIEIKVPTPNNILLFFLALIVLGCFIFPISLFFIDELDIGFGIIITFAIFWGTAIYFLRKILWNKVGKEIYHITKKEITYFFDYGVFKDNSKTIKFESLKIACLIDNEMQGIENISENLNSKCYLGLIIDEDKTINSNIVTHLSNIKSLNNSYTELFLKNS